MALDISAITSILPSAARGAPIAAEARAAQEARRAAAQEAQPDLQSLAADLERVAATLNRNRRLSFSVNEDLDRMVVKVIDSDTDKVIKEIPPEALQHVYERIREVIGLLIDEQA